MKYAYYYCKTCGRILHNPYANLSNVIIDIITFRYNPNECKRCLGCQGENAPLPDDVFNKYKDIASKPEIFQKFVDEYVKQNPEYIAEKSNQELKRLIDGHNKWEKIQQQRKQQELQRQAEQAEASKQHVAEILAKEAAKHPECPYCHSNNTHKISAVGRVADTAIWGIASDTIGNNFRCDDCHSTF